VARRRQDTEAGAVFHDLRRPRVLVDADAGVEGSRRQAGRELARVDERGVGLVPEAGEVGRRSDLGPDRVAVEELVLVAVALEQPGTLLEPLDLVWLERDREVARELEVAVDCKALDVAHEGLEVLTAEALELRHLRGEAREPVLDPVRERAEREASVPPAGTAADRVLLEDDHVAGGVVGLRVERRPEPREATADDAEIGLGWRFEAGLRLARGECSEPVRPHDRIREGRPLRRSRWARGPRERHGRGLRSSHTEGQRTRTRRSQARSVSRPPGSFSGLRQPTLNPATAGEAESGTSSSASSSHSSPPGMR
jgi:hypothetical protein